ncbi:hypothetical protein ACJ41O_015008 [Fusarium nematophilum]
MVHLKKASTSTSQQHGFTKSGVVIVGAGFSGMCMAIKLLEDGIKDFIIIEKSTGFGGTWKDNAYPGCCCDVLSRLYCFSFEQNPEWSRLYPEQEEILNYMRGVARKHDLYRFVRFSSEVTEARWDQALQQWKVSVRVLAGKEAEACEEYTIETNFLAAGTGQLNQPYYPEIPGQASFKGKTMHSARWDWSHDLRGKRVGIIGNGATAVQIVPEVAKVASHVTIFQRSPNWIIPRLNEDVPEWKRTLLRRVPLLLSRLRADVMDGREAYYQGLIQRNSEESTQLRQVCQDHLQSQLADRPDLWEILTPDYPPGCKRILLSDDYYPSLVLPNVSLETGRIQRISEDGVVVLQKRDESSEDLVDLDLIIFATGFRTQEFMYGIKVHGVGNRSLDQIWAKGASALYGVTVESLPNFGILYGPNTNLGHNSIILMIEAQTRYIVTLIKEVLRAKQGGQVLSIKPRARRIREWNEKLQHDLATSSFADTRCNSWYKNKDGLVTNNWSGTVVEYQKMISRVYWSDYELVGETTAHMPEGETYLGRIVEETLIGTRALIASTALGGLAAWGLMWHARGRVSL